MDNSIEVRQFQTVIGAGMMEFSKNALVCFLFYQFVDLDAGVTEKGRGQTVSGSLLSQRAGNKWGSDSSFGLAWGIYFFQQHCQLTAKHLRYIAACLARMVDGGDGVAIHGFHDKHSRV